MSRFDAYTATFTGAKHGEVFGLLRERLGTAAWHSRLGKGFHTFQNRHAIQDESGAEVAAMQWGGAQGDRIMVEVKGERTPIVVEGLREAFPNHRVTRVDSCVDFDHPGAFEELLRPCERIVRERKLYAERRGDWDLHPELGRTYMMGSHASAVRCRLYEKGRQPEYRHLGLDNLARLEVQVRPAKGAKEAYSELAAVDVWGASRWTKELAQEVLQAHIDPHPAGTVYRLTERDAALRWMCKQYGPHLASLALDLGGWRELGLTLSEMLLELEQEKRRARH
ncbi:unnamed protein product [marine sediment metagenome]|uniref:Rolling Circle replication initiation protein N-terminal domain-containing protein n=1 Tax=marine sediment metagenome TaxID=412755 RepID=X1S425_9ZZZZ